MGLPFFRFPLEIRIIVYECMFLTSRGGRTITPDATHTRRDDGGRLSELTVRSGLAFLQTCQQTHEEAAAVLYSDHVFYFDDTRHGDRSFRIEASDHCYHCTRPQKFPEQYPNNARGCDSAWDGKHYLHIPYCDFVTMHHWLSMIGEKNRLRIRHLHLHFSSSQFTDILGNRDEKGRPGELSPVGGDLVADALSFFGNGHNLDTVEVSFQKSTNEDTQPANNRLSGFGRYGYLKEAFLDLFRPGYRNSSLKCALSSIKGVKHLKCEEMVGDLVDTLHGTNLMDEARAGLREVKSMMESGHATRQKQDVSAIWTGRYVDQVEHSLSDPSNLASKLSALDLGGARMA